MTRALVGVLPGDADYHPRIPDPGVCRERVARLTGAERVMLDLLAGGYSTKEAAAARWVALHTARNQLYTAFATLGIGTVHQALAVIRRAEELDTVGLVLVDDQEGLDEVA